MPQAGVAAGEAGDAAEVTNALVALQHQYVDLLEEDRLDEASAAFECYGQLVTEIMKRAALSGRYSRQVLSSPFFGEAFTVVHGNR